MATPYIHQANGQPGDLAETAIWMLNCRPSTPFLADPLVPQFMSVFTPGPGGPSGSVSGGLQLGEILKTSVSNSPVVDSGMPGLDLIPPKLVQRILKGDFIDMYKMLP